ncbi:ABC transporter permease, partial [Promineifilum sp.]|uniref:ABC transporter permease n=1 Tax=Promineifilum sp. TaxID=2664178 RepID=UPI0035B4D2E2
EFENLMNRLIEEHGLNDPYPVQYARWLGDLLRGDWGWSPTYNSDVLPLLKRRLPVTAELTFYGVLVVVPLALISGVLAGWRVPGRFDRGYRLSAFLATSIPPFILGLFLLSIFYVGLNWFPPGRTGIYTLTLSTSDFRAITGFLTFDGLLNGRPDVTLDALRHLVLPVFTLGLLYWATISRVTRVAMIETKAQEYMTAARAKGLRNRQLEWRHGFRNAMLPAFTAMILSAAGLVTGVYVIESIFDFKGLSELVTKGFFVAPDAPLVMGFAVFSVLLVLPIMLVFDLLRTFVDPRLREEGLEL